MKIAVIGHIEWSRFLKVDHLPLPGEIIRPLETWEEAAGGGAVAAAQVARLAGECHFYTAVGNDLIGDKSVKQLEELGVIVHASRADEPTKESIVYIDKNKERTITVLGDLKPSGLDSSLPWGELADMDAVYFVSGNGEALEAARKARHLVATARVLSTLQQSSVEVDALVMSANDKNEQYESGDLSYEPKLVVKTEGDSGGVMNSGERYEAVALDEGDIKDFYGCGDSFAAGITCGLAEGWSTSDILELAAKAGAEAAQRNGAHGL